MGLRACLKRGIGFTVCPEASVRHELAAGSLRRLDFGAVEEPVSLVMIWHAEKWCSPLLAHFIRLTEERLSGD